MVLNHMNTREAQTTLEAPIVGVVSFFRETLEC